MARIIGNNYDSINKIGGIVIQMDEEKKIVKLREIVIRIYENNK